MVYETLETKGGNLMDSSSIKGKEVAMNRDTYIEKGGKTRKGEKEKTSLGGDSTS